MGIIDSLLIMIIGMGGVFGFLLLLVGVMNLITNLFPPVPEPPKPAAQPSQAVNADETLIAVLQAAVVAYESDKSTTSK